MSKLHFFVMVTTPSWAEGLASLEKPYRMFERSENHLMVSSAELTIASHRSGLILFYNKTTIIQMLKILKIVKLYPDNIRSFDNHAVCGVLNHGQITQQIIKYHLKYQIFRHKLYW